MATKTKSMQKSNQVNLVDIFLYLLRYWYWFVLCIAVAMGVTYYHYAKTQFTYRSDATVMIKTPKNQTTTVNLDRYNNMINSVNMTNEILELRSRHLMERVVQTLDADVNYIKMDGLREVELYRSAPVRMFFSREAGSPQRMSLVVTPKSDSTLLVDLSAMGRGKETLPVGDTIHLDKGWLLFLPTANFNQNAMGKPFTIRKSPVESAAKSFISRLVCSKIIHFPAESHPGQRCDPAAFHAGLLFAAGD